MKKLGIITIAIIAVLTLGISSCSNSTTPSSTDSQTETFIAQNNLDSPLPAGMVTSTDITDMTLEQPMLISQEMFMRGNNDNNMVANRVIFGRILRNYRLSQGTRDSIKTLLKNYYDCYKADISTVTPQIRQTIQTANASRTAILDSVKAGTLSVADARAELVSLNKTTRAAVQALVIGSGVCDCLNKLLREMGALIQQDFPNFYPRWQAWEATLSGPCFQ